MDVHDTPEISRTAPVKAGQVLTIEPGIYIPNSAEYPAEYRGIGIRIEDNVLVGGEATGGAPVVLSAEAPKEVDDIEAVMNGLI